MYASVGDTAVILDAEICAYNVSAHRVTAV